VVVNSDPATSLLHVEELANVRPLRPIRVLLAGREARYLRAVAFLFERRGYRTRLTFRPAALLEDVASFRPDVVVLVQDGSFVDLVDQATALLEQDDRLSVVLSTSRADAPHSDRLRFVAKWGAFPELAEAVERAWIDLPAR
jgi:FixJ family two-component response regulator